MLIGGSPIRFIGERTADVAASIDTECSEGCGLNNLSFNRTMTLSAGERCHATLQTTVPSAVALLTRQGTVAM